MKYTDMHAVLSFFLPPTPPPNNRPSSSRPRGDDGDGRGSCLTRGLTVLDEGGREVLGSGDRGNDGGEQVKFGDVGGEGVGGSSGTLFEAEAGTSIGRVAVAVVAGLSGIERAIAAGMDAHTIDAEVIAALVVSAALRARPSIAETRRAFPVGGARLTGSFETLRRASVPRRAVAIVTGFAGVERAVAAERPADAADAHAAQTLGTIGARAAEAVETFLGFTLGIFPAFLPCSQETGGRAGIAIGSVPIVAGFAGVEGCVAAERRERHRARQLRINAVDAGGVGNILAGFVLGCTEVGAAGGTFGAVAEEILWIQGIGAHLWRVRLAPGTLDAGKIRKFLATFILGRAELRTTACAIAVGTRVRR